MNPSVAIVILNWNGVKYLQQFLPSVMSTSYPNFTVVVADNASSDDSVVFLNTNYPQVKIVRLPENHGFAKGYNEALKQVQADYYVLLNSDVEVEKSWITPVVDLLESDKTIAACQPKLLMQTNKSRFEYAGASGGWIDYLGYPFARGRLFDLCEDDNGQYNDTSAIFWASGAAMFVRSAVYHQLKGLDEYFFAHMEEIDLCWRMQLAGYKIMVCPESVVYHVGGGTLAKENPQKTFLNFRNNLVMLAKNLPVLDLAWKLPLRIFLDAAAAWKALLGGKPAYFWAVLRAHGGFISWIFFHRRQAMFQGKPGTSLYGWCSTSIVWAYFVKKRSKFSEIMPRNS